MTRFHKSCDHMSLVYHHVIPETQLSNTTPKTSMIDERQETMSQELCYQHHSIKPHGMLGDKATTIDQSTNDNVSVNGTLTGHTIIKAWEEVNNVHGPIKGVRTP